MISIITPFHKKYMDYIVPLWHKLKKQGDFQWVLVPNNGAEAPEIKDKRVKVLYYPEEGENIGKIKKFASYNADGDIIVELDADDELTSNALLEIEKAFTQKGVKFAYSNSARLVKGEPKSYSNYWGWRTRKFLYQDRKLLETVGWTPSAHMMRLIYWAPNHVRAWDKKAYMDLGGHDDSLSVGDDHDLCCRFYIRYGKKGFKHINKCLYIYNEHGDNSYLIFNKEVQEQTWKNYIKYSRDMAVRWAKDEGLTLIDLGSRDEVWKDFKTFDKNGGNVKCDLEEGIPLKDDSVGVVRASHIVEHLKDPVKTMNEIYRVLAPGGWCFIDVPSANGKGAFRDPTHKSFWNDQSFWYYTDKDYARYIQPEYKGRFQVSRVIEWTPDNVPCVQADLIALKPPYDKRPPGEVKI